MKYEAEQQDLESALHPPINPEHTSTARQAQPLRAESQSTQRSLSPWSRKRSHLPRGALRQTAKTWASEKVSSEKKLTVRIHT